MIDYPTILIRKYPGKEWALTGDEYEDLEWRSDTPKPTKEELDSLWEEVSLEIEEEKAHKEEVRKKAIEKLEALGLTVEEIKEVFGIDTNPV
jgi:DNA-directed RNA polymerase specialized sigma24 family protein